jgi:hypothetical protein
MDCWEFIRYSVKPEMVCPENVYSIDWNTVFQFSIKQSITGVTFEGVKKLSRYGIRPPLPILFEWIALSEKITNINKHINDNVIQLVETIREEGFDSCVLKGQGNTVFYPNVFSRTPGDIDIWITPKEKKITEDQRMARILRYLRWKYPKGYLHYNHINAGFYNGIEVEILQRPRSMYNYVHNARMQKWIKLNRSEQFNNFVKLPNIDSNIAIPTWDFNVIFQLAHIYGHVLHTGIGLRHIIDYYYLLYSAKKRVDFSATLKKLGLWNIARAVMWVLRERLGLEDRYLIAPVDKKRGVMLLNDILDGGNFGYYKKTNQLAISRFDKNLLRLKRDFMLTKYYPAETLSEPLFRIFHFFWRLRNN